MNNLTIAGNVIKSDERLIAKSRKKLAEPNLVVEDHVFHTDRIIRCESRIAHIRRNFITNA